MPEIIYNTITEAHRAEEDQKQLEAQRATIDQDKMWKLIEETKKNILHFRYHYRALSQFDSDRQLQPLIDKEKKQMETIFESVKATLRIALTKVDDDERKEDYKRFLEIELK